jgi:hypothetical protein
LKIKRQVRDESHFVQPQRLLQPLQPHFELERLYAQAM